MSFLLDLPAELMEQILTRCSIPTLSKLSRTNKALHKFLTPELYHNIDWHWKDYQVAPPIDLLVRTLLRNPLRAKHIKSLRLRGGGITTEREWKDWSPDINLEKLKERPAESERSIRLGSCFLWDDTQIVARLVSAIYRPVPATWISEFERGSVDAIVAILLIHLDFIERLDLGFGYLHRSHFIPGVLRHGLINNRSKTMLPKLKIVELSLDVPSDPATFQSNIDLLRCFFFLPSVQSFNVVSPEPIVFAWPGTMPTASSLSTLILRKSSICERTIGQLLACTPRLKHLTYDHWRYIDWDWPGFGGDRQIRCRLLNMALSHVKDSLESLIIKVRFVSCEVEPPNHENSDYPCSISGRLNVIRSMRKLRSVEVPWLLLHNWDSEVPPTVWTDILPYTLQSLCIRDDLCAKYAYPWMPPREDIVYNHVSVLLNIKSRYFPQLRRVSFTYIWDCYIEGWRDGNAGRFQALCTSKDVYCEVNREGDLYRA